MSEFYRLRRVAIKDVTALIAFFLGFVWAGPFALPYFRADLDAGDMVRALAHFLTFVLVTALAMGAVGLALGSGFGAIWEWHHKRHRHRVVRHAHATLPVLPFLAPSGAVDGSPAGVAHHLTPAGVVRYTTGSVDAAAFLALADRTCPMAYAPVRVPGALARTINIGAWDESGRLVGVARVLSDGDTCTVLRDIMVDPDWQGHGIGRTLVERALAAAPGDEVVVLSPPTTAGFFERLGAERGPATWLLHRSTETSAGSGALEGAPLPAPALSLVTVPSRSARR